MGEFLSTVTTAVIVGSVAVPLQRVSSMSVPPFLMKRV